MKKIMMSSIFVFGVVLLSPQLVQAQGTMTYLSNLEQPSTGSLAVGSDSWLAASFHTGTNASGYVLDSVQLAMADASGNPSGFTVMLYSSFLSSSRPKSSLGTLVGSLNPTPGGIFTYTSDSNLTLSRNTSYFIVLTSGTTVANGAYDWSYAGSYSYNPSGGWGDVGTVFTSNDGSSWTSTGENAQFAINAIPVPEPGVLGLFGLGGLLFLWHRRK